MSAVRTARAFIEKAIKDHNVVVFSKTACPFSILAKRILSEVGVQEMQVYEIERREDGQEIQVRISIQRRQNAVFVYAIILWAECCKTVRGF